MSSEGKQPALRFPVTTPRGQDQFVLGMLLVGPPGCQTDALISTAAQGEKSFPP